MKKFTSILLIGVYALATMGFSLKEFYCCGKLRSKSISLIASGNDKFAKGNNNDGCCKDIFQYFKVKDDQIASSNISNPVKHFISLHLYGLLVRDTNFAFQDHVIAYRSNGPPLYRNVPLYISNCLFRI